MAGLFDSLLKTKAGQAGVADAAQGYYQPQSMSLSDLLGLAGAAAKQVGNGGDDINQFQQQLAARQIAQQKLKDQQDLSTALAGAGMGVSGSGGIPGAPGAVGQPFNPQSVLPALIRASLKGVAGTKDAISALQLVKPDIKYDSAGNAYNANDPSVLGKGPVANRVAVGDTITDLNDPGNTNRVIPQAPVKGALPVFDNLGHVVDWKLPPGARATIGQAAAATSQGAAEGSAPFEFVNATGPNGEPMTISKSDARGKTFVGQSPSQAIVANAGANTAATANSNLPQLMQSNSQTLDQINQLIHHPELANRTGLKGVLPAIPGTAGVDFDNRVDQLKGGVFLQAYSQLKGAGAITEVEGKKAEQAIARLDRKQDKTAFVSALNDLSSIIKTGQDRLQRQAAPAQGSPMAGPRVGTVQGGYVFNGGNPANPASWSKQ